jgi:hypothetical protein
MSAPLRTQVAAGTPYDNTGTSLASTNVQDAISEIAATTIPIRLREVILVAGYIAQSAVLFESTANDLNTPYLSETNI